jgi:hypothetical protein
MAKERNPNFIYVYSEVFKQEYAISRKSGGVTFQDGTKYSRKEIDIIAAAGVELTLAEHRVKKIIGGEIVGIERTGSGDKGKPVESGGAESSGNAANPSIEVAGTPKDGADAGSGERDIY